MLFASSFAYENAPNIDHITLDGERTPCGLTGWATEEGWSNIQPGCIRCCKAYDKLPDEEKKAS